MRAAKEHAIADYYTEYLTCSHCGHRGIDVRMYYSEKHQKSFPECTDRLACWQRWNKDNLGGNDA